MPRFVLTAGLALALAFVPAASSGVRDSTVAKGVPSGLHAFLLTASEPVSHVFNRTPSFAWTPAPEKGGHYDFELATSPKFEDSSIVFRATNVTIPAETVPLELPWMTGQPYALWAQVRWIANDGMSATRWSTPFGFNMQWSATDVPQQEPAPDGLIRWKPIDGATEYEVLYTDLRPEKAFYTMTNVADEREFFTFKSASAYGVPIHWRLRAIRDVGQLAGPLNGLPVVSYGPWSPTFTSINTPQTPGTLAPASTISNVWDATKKGGHAYTLTPGFAWTPDSAVTTGGYDPGSPLYRVYAYTDSNCVNRVFVGSIVGSPAFAPRVVGGPIALPGTESAISDVQSGITPLKAGAEAGATDATGDSIMPNEGITATSGSSSSSSPSASAGASPAAVDFWDSGWPSGRYYWTVIPVTVIPGKATTSSSSSSSGSGVATVSVPVTYQDTAVPQDACQAGDLMGFGTISNPVVTAKGQPFLSGIQPSGRNVAAAGKRAAVYASPIAAWEPTVGATKYQVQLSKTAYPWHTATQITTAATSVILPLDRTDVGTWYYRVRGINEALPAGGRAMTWSTVVRLKITGNQFAVVK
jgi:hypothetical protein